MKSKWYKFINGNFVLFFVIDGGWTDSGNYSFVNDSIMGFSWNMLNDRANFTTHHENLMVLIAKK